MIAVVIGSSTHKPGRPKNPPAVPVTATDTLCQKSGLDPIAAMFVESSDVLPDDSGIVAIATDRAAFKAAVAALSTMSGEIFSMPWMSHSKGLPNISANRIKNDGFSRYSAAS